MKSSTDPLCTLLARVKELDGKGSVGPWYGSAGGQYIYGLRPGDEVGRMGRPVDARLAREFRTAAPAMARALEAALEVHKKVPVYEWCAFNLPPADECHLGDDEHIELANGDWGHVSVIEAWTCKECHHDTDDEIPDWPCATVEAMTEHLGGET